MFNREKHHICVIKGFKESVMPVSGESTGAMVTLNHLSVEAPDDGSPLLPEAAEAATPTPLLYRQQLIAETDSREFSLGRYIYAGTVFI